MNLVYLYTLLKKHPGEITIIATGPLTNIAVLFLAYPEAIKLVKEVVFMGGAIGFGNTRPCSEFNIEVDPEAAHIVIQSGAKITMVPLEVVVLFFIYFMQS